MKRGFVLGLAVGGVALAAGAYVVGPGAAGLVEVVADGRSVWRLGTLQVSGVAGAWIGDLTAADVQLLDETGAWLQASDVRLVWRPGSLLRGQVAITAASAQEVTVSRQPTLSAPPRSRGLRMSVAVEQITVEALHLSEAVAGVEARLTVRGAVASEDGALQSLRLEALRADADTDRLSAHYAVESDHPWAVEAVGAPGGVIAGLLGAEEAVRIEGGGVGAQAGSGRVQAWVGQTLAAEAEGDWNTGAAGDSLAWRLTGRLEPEAVPGLSILQRLGGSTRFSGQQSGSGEITAQITAPALNATVTGLWDGAMAVSATSARIHTLLGVSGPIAETVLLNGTLRRDDRGGEFEGRAEIAGLQTEALRGSAAGPLAARLTRRTIAIDAAADIRGAVGGFALTEGRADLEYDRQSGAFSVKRVALAGPWGQVSAQGSEETLTGRAEMSDLGVVWSGLEGAAAARFVARRVGDGWRLEAEGAGQAVRAQAPVGALLGPRPRIEVSAQVAGGTLTIDRAVVRGPRLRIGVRGAIEDAALDLNWEASGRGPVLVSGVRVEGAVDATGRVLGRLSAPRVTGLARLATLDLGAVALAPAQVRFAIADGAGAVSVSGLYGSQPFEATGDVIVRSGTIAVEGLTAELGGLRAEGRVAVREGQLDGAFDFGGSLFAVTGGSGQVGASVRLSGTGERPILAASGRLREATFGSVVLDSAVFTAQGPAESLLVAVSAQGDVAGRPVSLSGEGSVAVEDGGVQGLLSVQGEAAGVAIQSLSPLTLSQQGQDRSVQGAFSVGAGRFDLAWREAEGRFEAEVTATDLPARLVAAAVGEQAEGTVSGRAALRSVGDRWEGAADLSARGLRVRGRTRSLLDVQVQARLADEALSGVLQASSADGLSASVDIAAPVTTDATPLTVRQRAGESGRAAWQVEGPADAVWALLGSADQTVAGRLESQGQAQFGPGVLTGEGRLSLTDGVFEDRLSGVRLQDVGLDVQFADDDVTVRRLTATDGDGGRLSGTGSLDAARAGSLTLDLDNLRLVDREDVTARSDGRLVFRWGERGSELSGSLNLTEATIRGAPAAEVAIPVMEVIEINRPEAAGRPSAGAIRRGPATRLSLQVTAPQRVFTRYRGADAEWSLNLSVRGTTQAPELYGEARLVRGEAQLAGRPLEFTRGVIRFQGPPEEAELDLVAVQESPDLTARVVLSGTVGTPEVTLENDRGLPEDEVLPLLLFGAAQEELSPLQAAQLAASLSALTGGTAFDLADLTRRIAGLDRFDIRQETDGILVAGGRYLTRRVYVELARTGLGEAQTRVEWRLTDNLTLITSFTEDGEQRASLRWREEDEAR